MTLKQRYASQLLDCNSTSIAKTLLVQMSKCSFTEFRNELARVLDTRRHAISKASTKPVTTKSIEAEEEDEEDAPIPPPKSSTSIAKKDKKINVQSTQIKDLGLKLDQAVAENSQIRELFSTATLTTAFSNALSTTKTSFTSQTGNRGNNQQFVPKPFLGKYRPSKLVAGKDGTTNPDQTCHYCKDTGHLLGNCVRLEASNKFMAEKEKKEKEGFN